MLRQKPPQDVRLNFNLRSGVLNAFLFVWGLHVCFCKLRSRNFPYLYKTPLKLRVLATQIGTLSQ